MLSNQVTWRATSQVSEGEVYITCMEENIESDC